MASNCRFLLSFFLFLLYGRESLWDIRPDCSHHILVVNGTLSALLNEFAKAGGRFSKAPETFRARKAIFSSSVSKHGEVYTPETFCMKGTSFHIKNTWIKQRCNHQVRDFAMAFRVRKLFGTFEKLAPGKVSNESLGRDETLRHTSHSETSQN